MNKNIDEIFREKLKNIQVDPKPESKRIFMNSLHQKKTNNVFRKIMLSAAVLLLFIFLRYSDQTYYRPDSQFYQDRKESGHITSVDSEFENVNYTENELKNKKQVHKITSSYSLKDDCSNLLNEELADSNGSLIASGLNELAESMEYSIKENIQPSESHIEIKISGLAEHVLYTSRQEMQSKRREISMQIANQKIYISSPVLDDVEETFIYVKNGLSQKNLTDLGKSLTNSINHQFNINKNQSQKSN